MRTRITYANVMATLALFLTLGGTAMAAITITGRNVADRSLTSADVKASSLGVADLSLAAKNTFRGAKGATGRAGSVGATGTTGADGQQGPRGSAAFMTSAFASRDTRAVLTTQEFDAIPNNNTGETGKHWDAPDYADFSMAPGISQLATSGTYNAVNLTSSWQPVLSLAGMSGSNEVKSSSGLLNLTFSDAYLNATASVTLLRRSNDEDFTTNSGTQLLNGRAECAIFYGTDSNPANLTSMAGVIGMVSSGDSGLTHELANMGLNASATGLTPGTQYNLAVKCRDSDYTGQTQWQLARGNLTAIASR